MNIQDLLNNKKLNQYTLSKKSGMPLSTVKKIVSGKHKIENCSGKTLLAISKALDCSIEDLLNVSFEPLSQSINDFTNKDEYYKTMIGNRKNVVLAKESASDYLHLSNQNLDEKIYVYSSSDLPKPFVVKKVNNFACIEYEKIDGLLVTSTNQTINDLLQDEESNAQTIYESLANYYFNNNESYDGLKIDKVNESQFEYYANEAKHYYDED